jgi:CRISPR type I-D-associated protein Csc1
MGQVISLHDHGVRLFACRLYNHDYLWFSSYEISKLSTALPVLHNYALIYSLGDFSYGISWETAPHYEEDLVRIPLYATPALATFWSRTRFTYNAINERTRGTDRPDGINSPDLGWRNYLDPIYPTDDRAAQQLGFACYVFTFDGRRPKGVTRLGKKGAAIRVRWEEIERPLAVFRDEPVRPTHPLNPLDISGRVNSYEPVNIPPHLLLRTAEVREDWFVFAAPHRVHVPKRVLEQCQV